jgi:hypothetical protein
MVSRQVFLINGDRVLAGGAGGVVMAARRAGSLVSMSAGGRAYAIPAVAMPNLGRGLSASLFDVAALLRAETAGRLPVRVSYRGRLPALPGVRFTSATADTAVGYLTASSARAFGDMLARRSASDHAAGSDGLFRGGVRIALAGAAVTPATRPGHPVHTLTVRGTNLAGRPDTRDSVFVWNVDNGRLSDFQHAFGTFHHGVATFRVPAGHYWAVGIFGNPETFTTSPARLVVLPQLTVSADTTVHVAERAASSKVTMVTPRPAVPQSDNLYLVRGLAKGPQAVLQFSNYHSGIWVSPTSQRPTVGWLQADVSQELTSPPGAANYGYALSYADPRGTIPSQGYLVRRDSLTTIHEAYYQEVKSPGYWTIFGSFPRTFNGYVEPYTYRGGLPGRRTIYLGGSPAATWASYYGALGAAQGYAQAESFRAIRPGEHLTDDWNRYPLHPAVNVNLAPANQLIAYLPSADRSGTTLTLDITPFGDNQPGHTSSGFSGPPPGAKITGTYQIDENGQKIASGNAAPPGNHGDFYTRAPLSPKPSVITFTLDATRAGKAYRLSTASRTVWTWRSAPQKNVTLPKNWYCYNTTGGVNLPRHCAVQPMMTLRYLVAGLALDGSVPPGRQTLTITAGHLPLGRAT